MIELCAADYANDLSVFYARFDCHNFHQEHNQRIATIAKEGTGSRGGRIVVGEEEVRMALTKVHPKKAAGPDSVALRVLKGCAEQLYSIPLLYFQYVTCLLWSSHPLQNVMYSACGEEKDSYRNEWSTPGSTHFVSNESFRKGSTPTLASTSCCVYGSFPVRLPEEKECRWC